MWHVVETKIHPAMCYEHLKGRERLGYFGVDGDDIKMGSSKSSVNARGGFRMGIADGLLQ
jgi:hypothetical protein